MNRLLFKTTNAHPPSFSLLYSAKPGWFKVNWLWLGKTLIQLKRKSEAKQWLQKLADAETSDIDENKVNSQLATPSCNVQQRRNFWQIVQFVNHLVLWA